MRPSADVFNLADEKLAKICRGAFEGIGSLAKALPQMKKDLDHCAAELAEIDRRITALERGP
jgi:hypothetical protein